MNPTLEVLATLASGWVIEKAADDCFYIGNDPVDAILVDELERNGWICRTRQPVVTGASLTGRLVLTARGRRYLEIMRRAA